MSEELHFNSLNDFKKYCKANSVGTGSGGGRARHASKTKARAVTNKLLSEIRSACSAPPWHLRGIFDSIYIESDRKTGKITVYAPFNEKAYRKSAWQEHNSFIPVLMDMGWKTKFATDSDYRNGMTRPTFGYFVGTGELTRIINNFNRAYASHGYRAEIDYDSSVLGFVPGETTNEK